MPDLTCVASPCCLHSGPFLPQGTFMHYKKPLQQKVNTFSLVKASMFASTCHFSEVSSIPTRTASRWKAAIFHVSLPLKSLCHNMSRHCFLGLAAMAMVMKTWKDESPSQGTTTQCHGLGMCDTLCSPHNIPLADRLSEALGDPVQQCQSMLQRPRKGSKVSSRHNE